MNEKTFTIKARGCSLFGEQTRVTEYTKVLQNTAFNLSVAPSDARESLSTNTKFSLENPHIQS